MNSERGYSLVSVMIALVIGMLLVLGLFNTMKLAAMTQDQSSVLTEHMQNSALLKAALDATVVNAGAVVAQSPSVLAATASTVSGATGIQSVTSSTITYDYTYVSAAGVATACVGTLTINGATLESSVSSSLCNDAGSTDAYYQIGNGWSFSDSTGTGCMGSGFSSTATEIVATNSSYSDNPEVTACVIN